MVDLTPALLKTTYAATIAGFIAPLLWGIGILTDHHPLDGSVFGEVMDIILYFFPGFLIFFIVPNAGSAVNFFLFFIATSCNIALYGIAAIILFKIFSFICSFL